MAKIYAQGVESVILSTASLVASGSISGSMVCPGYTWLVGIFRSDASAAAGAASGLTIYQSANYGANWDILSASYAVAACAASTITVPIVGNAIKVQWWNGVTGAASTPRLAFYAYPV